ncbi:WRKY transcription factor [Sarracenia purpurea var. burkii]
MSTQMVGFFSFPPNMSTPPVPAGYGCHLHRHLHQSVKTLEAIPRSHTVTADEQPSNPTGIGLLSSATSKQQREDSISHFRGPQLSLQKPSSNLWAWREVDECMSNKRSGGGDEHVGLGVSAMKMKKIKGRRKVREPRFCFKTMSDVDVLDDGYKWRKYGQKVVKNTQHPRTGQGYGSSGRKNYNQRGTNRGNHRGNYSNRGRSFSRNNFQSHSNSSGSGGNFFAQ